MRRTILRSAQIVCMAGTMFVLEVLGEVPGLEDCDWVMQVEMMRVNASEGSWEVHEDFE